MELRHLRYFVACAEEEHITRAAARLGIQQPPLSQQIKLLEQEIGVDLFDRRPRKISLNSAGKIFLSDARRILAGVDEAVTRVRNFALGHEATLMLGLTSSSSMHPSTISIIEEFRSTFPLIAIQIEEGPSHDLLTLIEEERLDFAFIRSDVDRYPLLDSLMLAMEPMVVAIHIKNPLAAERDTPLRLDQLAEKDFIVYRQANGAGIYETLLAACKNAGFEMKIGATTERMISAINMVAAGFGIAIVPKSIEAFQLRTVVYRELDDDSGLSVPLTIAFHRHISTKSKLHFLSTCEAQSSAGIDA